MTATTPTKKTLIEVTDIKHVNKDSLKAFVTVLIGNRSDDMSMSNNTSA